MSSMAKAAIILGAIFTALMAGYEIIEYFHPIPPCDHARCHVQRKAMH
jgi:hypothetical protein